MGFFNRPEAKRMARLAMRQTTPRPFVVTLLYIILTTVLTSLVSEWVIDPFGLASLYLMDGAQLEDIFLYIFTPGRVAAYVAMQLLITLYGWVMDFGYTSYALRLARREQPGYRNLLDGFAVLGRAILVNLLTTVFLLLWSLLALAPYMLVVLLGTVAGADALLCLALLLLLAAIVFIISVSYRYRLAVYFLLDNPEMGARESITRSKEAMRGGKWTLFKLDFSFLGWIILEILVTGILVAMTLDMSGGSAAVMLVVEAAFNMWLLPYMTASTANFYDWRVHGSFSTTDAPPMGGYQSPYDRDKNGFF